MTSDFPRSTPVALTAPARLERVRRLGAGGLARLLTICAATVIAVVSGAGAAAATDTWSGYSQLGHNQVKGIAAVSPTYPSVSSGLVDVFVIGTDDAVWVKSSTNYGRSYSGYSRVASNPVTGIAAAGTARNAQQYELDLLVVGTDHAVWQNVLIGCSTGCL